MAATFFGEVVKGPCRAGTEEEEEEEEQSRRDTPEDREVRRKLARKRSGSGKASPPAGRASGGVGLPSALRSRWDADNPAMLALPPPYALGYAACPPYFLQNYC